MPSYVMSLAKIDPRCCTLLLCANLLLVSASRAQERCGVEVKLLLSPTETQIAIASLNLGKETTDRIYFFDTSSLDLLSQGLIVRLRQGSTKISKQRIGKPKLSHPSKR